MTAYEAVITVTSFGAFAAAVFGVVVSRDANQRSHDTQKKLLDLEKARENDRIADRGRAEVRARFVPHGNGRRLQFYNEGQGIARNVRITVSGKPMAEDNRLADRSGGFETIGPGGTAMVIATSTLQAEPLFQLCITWDDESGRPGIWESDLNG